MGTKLPRLNVTVFLVSMPSVLSTVVVVLVVLDAAAPFDSFGETVVASNANAVGSGTVGALVVVAMVSTGMSRTALLAFKSLDIRVDAFVVVIGIAVDDSSSF